MSETHLLAQYSILDSNCQVQLNYFEQFQRGLHYKLCGLNWLLRPVIALV